MPRVGHDCAQILSPPAREAWIEMPELDAASGNYGSPPAREAWIEIVLGGALGTMIMAVASREGGVD